MDIDSYRIKYGQDLVDWIKLGFRNYDIEVDWIPDSENDHQVYLLHPVNNSTDRACICMNLLTVDKEFLSQLKESDPKALESFVTDLVNTFLKNNPYDVGNGTSLWLGVARVRRDMLYHYQDGLYIFVRLNDQK